MKQRSCRYDGLCNAWISGLIVPVGIADLCAGAWLFGIGLLILSAVNLWLSIELCKLGAKLDALRARLDMLRVKLEL